MNATVLDPQPLEILYQDEDMVAINKPAGLLVHRSRIDVHATEFAVQKLRDQINQLVFVVHRLDRPTSGVLLFALSSKCARRLTEQFANGDVTKNYRAIVRGHTPKHHSFNEPLKEKLDPISDAMAQPNKPPQHATTQFTTICKWEIPFSAGKYPTSRYSEVDVQPLTGRKHQIRRHFKRMAHPIIGDSSHGDTRHNRLFRQQLGISGLLLAATQLQVKHPITNRHLVINAEPSAEYLGALSQLKRLNIA